ncbi:glycosyl hydrolase family 18 protein [Citrobacter rodentium]|uniref:chitinase n=2 Tax=Citrobacter rodentium TaxID=67825 RepID=D2TRQ1_CITRI|nr:glycosyl hydrolase family 18 protein [Citrobacter rodentium]QBY29955.1 polysaccharide degrading enzyme [Citrobacter rodentium]UHO32658.1 polysaccharide degrading enzyme [Citrobacter rodentium NBRC 105723 = DSM 16636]CBG90311.1 putative polysaccharide degrading enzyme [Citrobacter rodentium ICC168]
MTLNKLTKAIILATLGLPLVASAASVVPNDQTNSFSGLDPWMMISKDLGYSWEAYTDSSQNNFPGSTYAMIAAKDELAIISQPYDPNSTYRGGEKVRFLGYYWTAQWWVDQGISPSTDPVWKQGDKVNFNIYSEFQFTPYTGQQAVDLQNSEKKKVKAQRKVIGYFPEWGVYEAHNFFTPDKVNYKGLSHLNYGFAVVKNGVVTMHDTAQAPDLMRTLEKLTEKNNVTFMLSVGGWDNSQEGAFEAATSSDEGIEKLADSMVKYVHDWKFDGLDIDWEYPDNETEKNQFTKLVKSLRSKLDAQGRKDDKYYQLSAAVTTNHKNVKYINPAVTAEYLDSINVMAYDIHGAFDPITGHNAPLFANKKDADQKLNVAGAMREYAEVWQIPKDKLMMGVPYYGRGWGSVPSTQIEPGLPGLFAPGDASVKGAWDDVGQYTGTNPWYVLKAKLASGEYKRYWDSQSRVPYLYSSSKQEFLTYDDPQSIREKVDYIKQQGFGGAIIWDISGDTPEHELGNIVDDILTAK